jgi:hypothetical protein
MIDENKYDFKEDGIYSKTQNKKINGYKIGTAKKYNQFKFICTDGKQKSLYIHVALWIHFNGEIPDGMELSHKDENTSNNVLSNLEIMTHIDNMNYGETQLRKANSIRNSPKIRKRREGK